MYITKVWGTCINFSDVTFQQSLSQWRSRRHAAHLYMDPAGTKVTWTADDATGSAFTNLTLTSGNERIVVPETGLYFVYSVITFNFKDVNVVPQVYHKITSQHPLKPRNVHEHVMSKYGGSANMEKSYTSFVCGVLHLQVSEQVGTHVSNFQFIDKSFYRNYFGIFQI